MSKLKPSTLDTVAKHKRVQSLFIFNTSLTGYDEMQVTRTGKIKESKGIKIPDQITEIISKTGVTFYPEFLEYVFKLEGVPKQLLLFLLFYYVDPRSNKFPFSPMVRDDFKLYTELSSGKIVKDNTLTSALKKLRASNIIINVKRGQYMLNPMLATTGGTYKRKEFIQEYSRLLAFEGMDPFEDFYPL